MTEKLASKRQTFGDRMAVLKNGRHEKFAQGLAEGKTADEAHTRAGYAPNRKNTTRLKANKDIQARVQTLQANAAAIVEFTLADMLLQVDEDRLFARELGQPGAAGSSSSLKAKLLGLITDKISGSVDITLANALKDLPDE